MYSFDQAPDSINQLVIFAFLPTTSDGEGGTAALSLQVGTTLLAIGKAFLGHGKTLLIPGKTNLATLPGAFSLGKMFSGQNNFYLSPGKTVLISGNIHISSLPLADRELKDEDSPTGQGYNF